MGQVEEKLRLDCEQGFPVGRGPRCKVTRSLTMSSPATLNAVAGLLTTIVNVYTAQKGVWSVTAKITAITTGCLIAIAGGLFATYNFWILEKVREAHEAAYYPEQNTQQEKADP